MSSVIVWDIETVPDIKGFAAANGHDGKSDDEIRAAMGDKFPKHIYHSIICIGALVAHRGRAAGQPTRSAHRTSGNAQRRR
jgi:predicted PolB exonuclease-like 3'-5' exonuclease